MSHYYLGTFNNLLDLLPPIKAKGPKNKHNSSAKEMTSFLETPWFISRERSSWAYAEIWQSPEIYARWPV